MTIDPFQHPSSDAFVVGDALRLGYSQHALRAGDLAAPTRGVRIPTPCGEVAADLLAALLAVQRPDQFFSHSTAARIHGLPLPSRIHHLPIHVASPSYTGRMRRPDVRGHRIRARVVAVAGLSVESVEDCFVHVATELEHGELVALGDAIVARDRSGRLEIADLVRNAAHFRGARGMVRVDRALRAIRVGAESPRESMLRLLIVGAGLPEPELQVEVRDAAGTFVARLDTGWPALRVGVEYDGQQHRVDDRQYARDIERHRRLEEVGWRVIRVTARELDDGGRRIVGIIRAAVRRAERGAP